MWNHSSYAKYVGIQHSSNIHYTFDESCVVLIYENSVDLF